VATGTAQSPDSIPGAVYWIKKGVAASDVD